MYSIHLFSILLDELASIHMLSKNSLSNEGRNKFPDPYIIVDTVRDPNDTLAILKENKEWQ